MEVRLVFQTECHLCCKDVFICTLVSYVDAEVLLF